MYTKLLILGVVFSTTLFGAASLQSREASSDQTLIADRGGHGGRGGGHHRGDWGSGRHHRGDWDRHWNRGNWGGFGYGYNRYYSGYPSYYRNYSYPSYYYNTGYYPYYYYDNDPYDNYYYYPSSGVRFSIGF